MSTAERLGQDTARRENAVQPHTNVMYAHVLLYRKASTALSHPLDTIS
jgi:hypothetical protein